jgi:hypothetical protein
MFTRSALVVTQLFTDLRRTVHIDDTSKVPYLSYGFIQGLESVAQRFNQWGCVRDSGLNKRSLASKYLHFHVPELFYISDSRAYDDAMRNSELLSAKLAYQPGPAIQNARW